MPRALIAGAGIAGLTAALALDRAGYEVAVFERRDPLSEFGAGLQITPNAARVLDRLGALALVEALALEPREIVTRRGSDDAVLTRLPIGAARKRWGAPYLVLHRGDLLRALADACCTRPRIALKLGAAVEAFEDGPDGVALTLRGAAEERGDLLIGADGLRSKVRERLGFGAADKPDFSGRVAFRAAIPTADLPLRYSEPDVNLRLGPRAHLVHYPLVGGATVNIVATIEAGWRDKPGEDPWDGEADRGALRKAFASWSREARSLVDGAPVWRAWPLCARPPLRAYAAGRVALAGDAAHPMVPFLAQGAAQAIEDAGALERRLRKSADIELSLAAYSRERAPRAGRVQRAALAQAAIYHMSGPLALARDTVMRLAGPERLLERYDWIYSA